MPIFGHINLNAVKRNKLFLYASVTLLWVMMVVFTLGKDDVNTPWNYETYTETEPQGRVEIESGLASVLYGPLASGDTQVVLRHGTDEVQAVVPLSAESLSVPPTVFPMGEKRLGVAFHGEKRLDTVVMFAGTEALVFENVLAMDTELDRIACLQANAQMEIELVISSLDKLTEQRMRLPQYPASFLDNPQVDHAVFKGKQFRLGTVWGTVTADLSSLI